MHLMHYAIGSVNTPNGNAVLCVARVGLEVRSM